MTTGKDFVEVWNFMAKVMNDNAKAKGFWDVDEGDGTKIALIHSELSEALEGIRAGNPQCAKIPDFTEAEEELADAVIRIMDYSVQRGWDIGAAILAKYEYNTKRPFMHGKKF